MFGQTIGRKLKNQNGATLLIALLAFVICALVGAIVLAGATGVSGRGALASGTRQEADQRHYTLESAAALLESQIEGQTVYAQKVVTTTTSSDSTTTSYSHEGFTNTGDSTLTLLEELVAKGWGGVESDTSDTWNTTDATLTAELTISMEGLNEVSCALTASTSTYDITAILTISGGSDSITIYFPSTVTEKPELKEVDAASSSATTTSRIKVSWNNAMRG